MKIELNTLPATPTEKNDHILWNQSVKAASMLYRWKLVDSYESILRIINIHQKYLQQETFQPDHTFLPQLEEQLPKVDGPRIWACFHVGLLKYWLVCLTKICYVVMFCETTLILPFHKRTSYLHCIFHKRYRFTYRNLRR